MEELKRVYLIDCGILLNKNDREYSFYNGVYDKKHAYYDYEQYYIDELDDAITEARKYVLNGCERTYAIVSIAYLPIDVDTQDAYVEEENYRAFNVEFSIARLEGNIIENFVLTGISNNAMNEK